MSTRPAAHAAAAAPDPERVARLVRAAQGGDPLALAGLMDVLAPYVGRICGPIALDDGQDAAQEALIVILRSIKQLKTPAALFGWVRVIAVREAVRVAKRGARTVQVDPADLGNLADASIPDPHLGADVADVLSRLTPEHRAVLMLRDLEGVDEETAAKILALPTGTVRSRLFRARRGFRKEWER